MIKISTIIILLTAIICSTAHADKYYLLINRDSTVRSGAEAGDSEKGDVVSAIRYDPNDPPTKAELAKYKIVVVDLPGLEKEDLLEPETTGSKDTNDLEVVRFRKKKIDIDSEFIKSRNEISHVEENERENFRAAVTTKPVRSVER